jgi:murein DD-endopeptidase MepM/ murein hydrolase activator NlpD
MSGACLVAEKLVVCAMLALLALSALPAGAQNLYKYRDANGVWVFTDRKPDGQQAYEQRELRRTFEQPEVRLFQRSAGGAIDLIAQNTYYGPVQLAFRLSHMDNLSSRTPRSGIKLLPARSESTLLVAEKSVQDVEMSFEYEFQFLPGDPAAEHSPDRPYRLPYALSTSARVSQAFPDTSTHGDPSSRDAIDFVMPIGTNVFAARDGVVIEVASDFFESGTDRLVDGPRANVVRVLHDDGTMSLYAHLNWNSIRVVPGQRVERGQYLADSGNTGFTTGPHLHFVVQRNKGGAIVSVPIEFAGAGGAPITVHSGETYTAY